MANHGLWLYLTPIVCSIVWIFSRKKIPSYGWDYETINLTWSLKWNPNKHGIQLFANAMWRQWKCGTGPYIINLGGHVVALYASREEVFFKRSCILKCGTSMDFPTIIWLESPIKWLQLPDVTCLNINQPLWLWLSPVNILNCWQIGPTKTIAGRENMAFSLNKASPSPQPIQT